jgi:hypothetical protein
VQKLLRQTLMVPANMPVAVDYTDAAGFKRLYDSMLDRAVDEALPRFSARSVDFTRGGQHHKLGEDAARAAIVPPVALLCSLLGAVGHFAKLLYLIAKLLVWLRTPAGQAPGRTATRAAGLALIMTLVCVWTAFSLHAERHHEKRALSADVPRRARPGRRIHRPGVAPPRAGQRRARGGGGTGLHLPLQ